MPFGNETSPLNGHTAGLFEHPIVKEQIDKLNAHDSYVGVFHNIGNDYQTIDLLKNPVEDFRFTEICYIDAVSPIYIATRGGFLYPGHPEYEYAVGKYGDKAGFHPFQHVNTIVSCTEEMVWPGWENVHKFGYAPNYVIKTQFGSDYDPNCFKWKDNNFIVKYDPDNFTGMLVCTPGIYDLLDEMKKATGTTLFYVIIISIVYFLLKWLFRMNRVNRSTQTK